MNDGELILVAGALLAAGLAAALLASRLRVPSLILFLGVGMLIGSDGTGWIEFNDYELARTVGIIALALILFEGGLTSGLIEIRPVLGSALSLAIFGTIATAVIAGFVAAWLFDLTTLEGMLLGSIIATTDGAAIFALLRGSTLKRRLARTLEGEAGMNDPVAILLVLGFIEWIQEPEFGFVDMVGLFVEELGIGLAVGVALGWASVEALKRVRLDTAGLFPVASLTVAALAFGIAEVIGGSGFIAVYLAGLALGGAAIPAKRTITTFHQGLAWVAQVALFLVLGLLVFPSRLGDVALEGTLLALVVVLVARPAGVFLATAPFPYRSAERVVLSWAGLRGALPVVLATFPVIAGIAGSEEFFDIVFFAVLLSTLLQGSTFERVARRLRATTSQPALPQPLAERGVIRRLGAEVLEHPVRRGRRDRRCPRPRPRFAARGRRERHRPRRRGDPAAWLDPPARRRPPPPAGPLGERERGLRPARALAHGTDRTGGAPAPPDPGPSAGVHRAPLAGRGRRPGAPEGGRPRARHRAPARAPRRPGRARGPRRRALRDHGPDHRGRRSRGPHGLGETAPRALR